MKTIKRQEAVETLDHPRPERIQKQREPHRQKVVSLIEADNGNVHSNGLIARKNLD